MNIKNLKMILNEILENKNSESSYIEYKKSELQPDKILKTICAYGNNYYRNENQYIFIGVEEQNDENNKAIPKTPIEGIQEYKLEIVYNSLNSLRSYIHPNIKFEIIRNEFHGRYYFAIVVPNQKGGPFAVTEKAENDKKINLKSGRYIRNDFETKLASVSEEYELIKKFANYSFDEDINETATIDDLNIDYIREYISTTSLRSINQNLSKIELSKILKLADQNDPNGNRVYNFAVLMFADNPDLFIKNSYIELIVDINGTKKLMESKTFKGPIWKQYFSVTKFIKDNYLNTITVRRNDDALSYNVENFPFTAVEELIANAIIHNDYQNNKCIQIYINENEINIVNYNNPMPPLEIRDLNERRIFHERNSINPTLKNKFKELHIIESFGTGIGEAKKAMEENNSPSLYYKYFSNASITSVVIPINEDFYLIKHKREIKNSNQTTLESPVQTTLLNSKLSNSIKNNLLKLYSDCQFDIISNSKIQDVLGIKETMATEYIKIMLDLNLLIKIEGLGKGKYKFIE